MIRVAHIRWQKSEKSDNVIFAFNYYNEKLGRLVKEHFGRFQQWCWYQTARIRMSPGCLQEVRDKQKEMFNTNSKVKKKGEKNVESV